MLSCCRCRYFRLFDFFIDITETFSLIDITFRHCFFDFQYLLAIVLYCLSSPFQSLFAGAIGWLGCRRMAGLYIFFRYFFVYAFSFDTLAIVDISSYVFAFAPIDFRQDTLVSPGFSLRFLYFSHARFAGFASCRHYHACHAGCAFA